MSMYSLLEQSDNCSMKSGSLWNYHIDEVNIDSNENNAAGDYRISNNKTTNSLLSIRQKILGKIPINNNALD